VSDRERIESELRALAVRRWRLAVALTAVMMATYFGFLFMVAWLKPFAGTLAAPGLSWGILFGVLVIVVAWAVTGVYVAWANFRYDRELASLRASLTRAETGGSGERGEG
jgi:uncharacterized membrane protein (DUF485 family)